MSFLCNFHLYHFSSFIIIQMFSMSQPVCLNLCYYVSVVHDITLFYSNCFVLTLQLNKMILESIFIFSYLISYFTECFFVRISLSIMFINTFLLISNRSFEWKLIKLYSIWVFLIQQDQNTLKDFAKEYNRESIKEFYPAIFDWGLIWNGVYSGKHFSIFRLEKFPVPSWVLFEPLGVRGV